MPTGSIDSPAVLYSMSEQTIKFFEITLADGTTTHEITSLIEENGYHAYDLTEEGFGCRYWVESTINLLSDNGILQLGMKVT